MLSNMNSVIIEGNLVEDPEIKTTPNGTAVCQFAIASNRYYKANNDTEKETSFLSVETWAKLAENCASFLKKGKGVRVVGRIKQDRWVDQHGKHNSRVKIVADHVDFMPGKKQNIETKKEEDKHDIVF
ncbi:MAG TPA: single-stranded DNA-binding protein [Spirochaetales bacterium]|nr:single-stranded DNA-binding protein [Spirochaetales bacterium]